MKYRILDHAADLKMEVFGKDREALFLNCLEAAAEYLKPELQKSEVERGFEVESSDSSLLLADFLNEVLSLGQAEKEVYLSADFSLFSEKKIRGFFKGRKVSGFQREIKGATYHSLRTVCEKRGCRAVVLFDV